MDERPRRISRLLALLWLPLALAVMLPVMLVLGACFYLRALASGLASLAMHLVGRQPPAPGPPTQPPHFLDAVPARKEE